jgi:hypothetical protein
MDAPIKTSSPRSIATLDESFGDEAANAAAQQGSLASMRVR